MNYIIPSILVIVILAAIKSKTPVYSSFTDGAAEGVKILANIFPAMLAVMTAAHMLRASGAFDILCGFLKPVTDALGIPAEILPLMLLRPVSGSGSMGLLSDTLNTYGADSFIGKAASVITGSTETTFYCICVYFANTRIKHSARVIPCAVIGDIIGMMSGIIILKIMR